MISDARTRLALILATLIFLATISFSQTESASVSGRVTDASGSVVPETEVQLQSTERGTSQQAISNQAGIYSFPIIQPGQYHMTIRKAGFRQIELVSLVVNVQDHIEKNFALQVGSVSESITVTGGAPLVNTEDASVSTVVDRNFAENLPMNGRSFQTLIQLTPGVVTVPSNGSDGGQFSINGQRAAANYWMVDGVSANIGVPALFTQGNGIAGALPSFSVQGGTNSLVSVDALQEFRIQTSTYAPEFGRTPGGQISIATRSGTNQFHGSLFDYLRNDSLDANDWFADRDGLPKPQERQNDFGGTLGGRLLRDRAFFFLSYEGLRLRLPQVVESNVPSRFDHDIEEFSWGHDNQSIAAIYRDGVSLGIARIETTAEAVELPARLQEASRYSLSVSRSGDMAWVESDGTRCSTIQFLRGQGTSAYTLVDLNPQIKDWALGVQEVVRWKNATGIELEGIIIKPVGYREGRRYPLIVNAYPGRANGFFAEPMTPDQAWVSSGYVVFHPNPRTPNQWMLPFKTEAFDHEGKGPKGLDVMLDDVLSGVEELIRRGLIDPARMGLYGHSNGGGVVNQLVTQTNRFKCAVSVAAALGTDWSRPFFLHTLDPFIPPLVGVTPWQDPNAYIQLSAIYRMDRVSTRMLLAVGDNDGDFLLNQIETYNALRWLGKDVTLLRYPDQGHEFTGWAMADLWNRENSFFESCLKQ